MPLNIDLETASRVDLRAAGLHRYAADESTHILCASYSFDGGRTARRWRAWDGDRVPPDLNDALLDPTVEIRAWNAEFERLLLNKVEGYSLPPGRFHCTMARARSMALPGRLDNVARCLGLPVQKQNSAVMLKWCRPLPAGGWADDPAEFERLLGYCDDDMRVEAMVAGMVRELTPVEREDYDITAETNARGIMIDRALARAAQHYARDELADICARLKELTAGQVESPRQFARIKDWLQVRLPEELRLPETPREGQPARVIFDSAVREELLEQPDDALEPDVREFIELVDDAGRSSIAKFKAMDERAAPGDDRVRGSYTLYGAGQTGRFSSSGLQMQNMIRAKLDDPERVVEAILRRVPKADLIALSGHNVMTTLSRCLRPAVIAAEGCRLVWGDWSAIEARITPWLSNDRAADDLLAAFARGDDVYVRQACATFGTTPDQITPERRQVGKVQILAFGFLGGAGAMMAMARAYNLTMTRETAEDLKQAWRLTNPWAMTFGTGLQNAAFNALHNPETTMPAGRVAYLYAGSVLWCVLPSGHVLAYPFARIDTVPGRAGDQPTITAIKASRQPKRGVNDWPRMNVWPGLLVENVTQAEAASLLRHALRILKRRHGDRFPVVGHSHDEIICEVPEADADAMQAELADTMSAAPDWATGLPLAAEAGQGYAYSK